MYIINYYCYLFSSAAFSDEVESELCDCFSEWLSLSLYTSEQYVMCTTHSFSTSRFDYMNIALWLKSVFLVIQARSSNQYVVSSWSTPLIIPPLTISPPLTTSPPPSSSLPPYGGALVGVAVVLILAAIIVPLIIVCVYLKRNRVIKYVSNLV